MKNVVENVPRYYETYVNDCFATAYGAVLSHMGHNPNIVLADYLSFMANRETGYFGTTYMYRYSTSVEFTEEELNTSLEFAYFPQTTYFSTCPTVGVVDKHKDRIHFNLYIDDDSEVAAARLEQLIDSNMPVSAVVDLYYMNYHRAFQKERGLHAVVITGYDKTNKTYNLFDKYLLSSSDFDGELSMEDVITARTSDVRRNNPVIGEYTRPIRNLWMEFNAGPDFKITDEKLFNVIHESYLRMSGQKEILGQRCGLQAIEDLRLSFVDRKDKPVDEATVNFFKEYYNTCLKRVARGRHRFRVFIEEISSKLPAEAAQIMIEQLQESAKRWDIIANISLKFAISKSPRMLDDIERNLQGVIDAESKIVEQLQVCNLKMSM